MSAKKNNSKVQEMPIEQNPESVNPENIYYYTHLLSVVVNALEPLIYDPCNLNKAVRSATCEEFNEFKVFVDMGLSLLEVLDEKQIEDYFNEE